MTAERPHPPVPADCDLRNFAGMLLDVKRLRDSDIANDAPSDVFRAAILLWCASWHQVPSASLPNDDAKLARYAGFHRDLKGWRKVKEWALHGFVLCSDGRLYHSVVAEKANEAFTKKRSYEGRTAAATEAAASNRRRKIHGSVDGPAHGGADGPVDGQPDGPPHGSVQPPSTETNISIGKDNKEESLPGTTSEIPNKNRDSAQSPPANAGAIAPPEPPSDDPSGGPEDQYWALAKSAQIKGISRSMLGKYAKLLDGDFVAAIVNLEAALRTSEPSKYFAKIVTTAAQLLTDEPRSTPKKNGKWPEWVRRFADEGYECVPHKTNPGWWRIGRDVYNAQGELEGA